MKEFNVSRIADMDQPLTEMVVEFLRRIEDIADGLVTEETCYDYITGGIESAFILFSRADKALSYYSITDIIRFIKNIGDDYIFDDFRVWTAANSMVRGVVTEILTDEADNLGINIYSNISEKDAEKLISEIQSSIELKGTDWVHQYIERFL